MEDVNQWYGRALEDKVFSCLKVGEKTTINQLTDLISLSAPSLIRKEDLHKRIWTAVRRLKWLQKVRFEYEESKTRTKIILVCLVESEK